MDDPRFAGLSDEDQVKLLGMSIDQQWDIGWGPYPETVGAGGRHGPGKAAGGYGHAAGGWQPGGHAHAQAGHEGVTYDPATMPNFLFRLAGENRERQTLEQPSGRSD